MDDILSYYRLLDIQPGATQEEIKQAYRNQAKLWHPDRFPDNLQQRQAAEERIKALNIAYEYLRDHEANNGTQLYAKNYTAAASSGSASRAAKPRYQTTRARAESYLQEGADLAKTGDYQAAADALSMAIRLNPNYAEAYHLRSFIFSSLGFEHRAKSDKSRARKIEFENAIRSRQNRDAQRAQSSTMYPSSSSPSSSSPFPSSSTDWQCTQTLTHHQDEVTDLAFAQSAKVLISSGIDGYIHLWNVIKSRQFGTLSGHNSAVHAINVSSDSQLVVSGGSDCTVKLWHLRTGNLIHTFVGHTAPVRAVAFSPNRKIVVSASEDGTIRFWDVQQRMVMYTLQGHSFAVQAIAINPNGLTLVSSDARAAVRCWDMQRGKCIQQNLTSAHDIAVLDFSPNRRDLLLGRLNGTIERFDTETMQVIDRFEGHQQAIQSVTFTQTGQLFASGSSDRTIKIWSLDGYQTTLEDHRGSVNAVTFSPDGLLLASGSGDHTIKLWAHQKG